MNVSVVIPALDEEAVLPGSVAALLPHLAPGDEVIVADGGSRTDPRTVLPEDGRLSVVAAGRGRGRQMNTGVLHASGDILLFLHADSVFGHPAESLAFIREVMAVDGIAGGAFRFKLDADGPLLRLTERGVAWRCAHYALPYGDQGIFTSAALFRRIGGYKHWDSMEDADLVHRLRREGELAMAQLTVVTSARRWRDYGYVRTTWRHWSHFLRFYLAMRNDSPGDLTEGAHAAEG